MLVDKCSACQKDLEVKEFKDQGRTFYKLFCPKCKYEVDTLIDFRDLNKEKGKENVKPNS